VNSLPKTVTRQRRGCDLNPGPSAPESSMLTTRLPSRPYQAMLSYKKKQWAVLKPLRHASFWRQPHVCALSNTQPCLTSATMPQPERTPFTCTFFEQFYSSASDREKNKQKIIYNKHCNCHIQVEPGLAGCHRVSNLL